MHHENHILLPCIKMYYRSNNKTGKPGKQYGRVHKRRRVNHLSGPDLIDTGGPEIFRPRKRKNKNEKTEK